MKATKAWEDNVYPALLSKYGVLTNRKITLLTKNKYNDYMDKKVIYIWLANNSLNMFPVLEPTNGWNKEEYLASYYSLLSIPLADIEFFAESGELYRETKISGGGGGSSLGGAIIGGLIAGEAGAVIGSRKGTEAIKSETVTHDDRETIINYFENGNRKTIKLAHEDYQVLEDLLPEKNYNVVFELKKQNLVQQSVKVEETKAITEQIKELAKLRDDGILTEDEFATKKKELLAKM